MTQALCTVREINTAVWENVSCRNNGVYCQMSDHSVLRVTHARTTKGILQVKTFHGWVVPVAVWKA